MWIAIRCTFFVLLAISARLFFQKWRRLHREMDELRASEEGFRLLFDSIHDYALCFLDADGRVASWNAGGQRLLGYPAADILGRHLCCLYTDAAVDAGELTRDLQQTRTTGRCERRDWHLRRNGSRVRMHTVMTSIRDGEGHLLGYAIAMRELIPALTAQSLVGLSDDQRAGLASDLGASAN